MVGGLVVSDSRGARARRVSPCRAGDWRRRRLGLYEGGKPVWKACFRPSSPDAERRDNNR